MRLATTPRTSSSHFCDGGYPGDLPVREDTYSVLRGFFRSRPALDPVAKDVTAPPMRHPVVLAPEARRTTARRPRDTLTRPSAFSAASARWAVPTATVLATAISATVGSSAPGCRAPERICPRSASAMSS